MSGSGLDTAVPLPSMVRFFSQLCPSFLPVRPWPSPPAHFCTHTLYFLQPGMAPALPPQIKGGKAAMTLQPVCWKSTWCHAHITQPGSCCPRNKSFQSLRMEQQLSVTDARCHLQEASSPGSRREGSGCVCGGGGGGSTKGTCRNKPQAALGHQIIHEPEVTHATSQVHSNSPSHKAAPLWSLSGPKPHYVTTQANIVRCQLKRSGWSVWGLTKTSWSIQSSNLLLGTLPHNDDGVWQQPPKTGGGHETVLTQPWRDLCPLLQTVLSHEQAFIPRLYISFLKNIHLFPLS